MGEEVYAKQAEVLRALPQEFPASESGIEIQLLKMLYSPEEADLFCVLRRDPETPEHIAERAGYPKQRVAEMLRPDRVVCHYSAHRSRRVRERPGQRKAAHLVEELPYLREEELGRQGGTRGKRYRQAWNKRSRPVGRGSCEGSAHRSSARPKHPRRGPAGCDLRSISFTHSRARSAPAVRPTVVL